MDVLSYTAIEDSPARKPAGADTTSALFVPVTPRRRQLISFKVVYDIYLINNQML